MADNIMWSPHLKGGDTPLYIQLADEMASSIANGELRIGEKLPAQRQLAWHLNINLSTVTKAFQLASKRHLISGEVGRGTYILAQSSEAQLYELQQSQNEQLIDLSTHVPASFESDNDLIATVNQLTTGETSNQFNEYLSPHALKHIQISASKWLKQLNYDIEAEFCIATNTAQNALLVSLLACCDKNDVVLVDELTFPGMKTVAKQLKLKLHGVKMDEKGLIPDSLDLALRSTGARVLVSDPTLQNPTASCMSAERQAQICHLIKKHNILFIEEYVVGSLANTPPISGPIKKHSLVITSFAKAVNPGVRFAVIAGKHPVIQLLLKETHATTWQLCPLMSQVACQWINSGLAQTRREKHIEEMNVRFRLFKTIFPSSDYPGNANISSHVWLATRRNSEQVQQLLHHLGVEVVPSKYFAVSHQFPHFIRVSLSAAKTIKQLKIALSIIKESNTIRTVLR